MNKDRKIICRCEDLDVDDIRELVEQGYTTLEEIKRVSRAGMGPCQGKTCGPLIEKEILKITGKKIDSLEPPKFRPPFGGLFFKEVAGDCDEE